MILQSLNRYYDILLEDPDTKIAAFGYSTVGVSFALDISRDGELLNVLPLFDQVQRGKKMVEVPRTMIVPAQVKRAVNVAPISYGITPSMFWVSQKGMRKNLNTVRIALRRFASGIATCWLMLMMIWPAL